MKPIRINQGKTFSLGVRLAAAAFTCGSMIFSLRLVESPISIIIAILLSLILPASWFATKIIEVDVARQKIFAGNWVMDFRWGKWMAYQELKIQVVKQKIKLTEFQLPEKKKMVTDHEYQVFLSIDGEATWYLFSHPLKKRIDEKINVLEKKLGILK